MVTELPLWASVGFTSNNASKRIIESFFPASAKRSCQHIKKETAQVKGKLGGGGVNDKNVRERPIQMKCPILFSAPAPTYNFAPP